MRNTRTKNKKIATAISNYVKDNIKTYILVAVIFFAGLILSVIFVNNIDSNQKDEINNYITTFTNSIKDGYVVDRGTLFANSIWNNTLLCVAMWFAGSTVIGIPIVLGIVGYRGFCIGYTVSALIFTYGTNNGTLFFMSSMLLQNIIIIPCILSLAVSGMNLYRSIIKDRRRENVKIEIIRHTVFSLLIFIMLIVASLIETYISTGLLQFVVRFIQ